jgi:hypothetical protein
MAEPTLLQMLREVRGDTLKLLTNVDEPQAHFAPQGTTNTILWHAGHALIVVEHLVVMPLTGKPPTTSAGWFEKFGWDSRPAMVKAWPLLSEVIDALKDQQSRVERLFDQATPQQLDTAADASYFGDQSVRTVVIHGLLDEAAHFGEVCLIRKLWRAAATANAAG